MQVPSKSHFLAENNGSLKGWSRTAILTIVRVGAKRIETKEIVLMLLVYLIIKAKNSPFVLKHFVF